MAYGNIRKGMKRKPIRKVVKTAVKAKRAAAPKAEKSRMLEEKLADKEL